MKGLVFWQELNMLNIFLRATIYTFVLNFRKMVKLVVLGFGRVLRVIKIFPVLFTATTKLCADVIVVLDLAVKDAAVSPAIWC